MFISSSGIIFLIFNTSYLHFDMHGRLEVDIQVVYDFEFCCRQLVLHLRHKNRTTRIPVTASKIYSRVTSKKIYLFH